MSDNYISIGKALACLDKGDGKELGADCPREMVNYDNIRLRYVELKKSLDELNKILNSIPHSCCPSSTPFLDDNNDFFIAYHILSESFKININSGQKLIKHLNDCYWCFKSYNQFIRDYHYTNKKLIAGDTT